MNVKFRENLKHSVDREGGKVALPVAEQVFLLLLLLNLMALVLVSVTSTTSEVTPKASPTLILTLLIMRLIVKRGGVVVACGRAAVLCVLVDGGRDATPTNSTVEVIVTAVPFVVVVVTVAVVAR